MAWRLAWFVALLIAQQAAPPAQPPAQAWPPPGVYRMPDVDVRPRLIQEVKPRYTGAAMRARIQGDVTLSCVVLADGTVADVRVTKSLDAALGLDNEAIIAVKQWRFSPAMKGGSPVSVVADVNLSFTLRDGPATGPTLTWPEGFDAPLDAALTSAEWRHDTFEVLNLRITISYPPGWTAAKSASEQEIIGLRKAGGLTTLGISSPQPAMVSLDRPLTHDQLQRAAGRMTESAAARGMKVESLGFGQAPAASHIWVWHAFRMPSLVTPDMAAAAAATAQTFDGGRVWTFYLTAGEHGFTVFCLTGIPRSMSESDKASFVTSEASVFGEILRRMSITVVR